MFRRGEAVIVVDSKGRKDECDLIFPADHVTTERMAFAIRHSTGIIYVVAEKERLDHFGLHSATYVNTERFAIGSTVSTTYIPGSSGGLSASDRAATARALCNRSNSAEAFSKPGHMFPVICSPNGVFDRPGHTEAAYDMCRITGNTPVACMTELTLEDGSMLRSEEALEFGQKHGILAIKVEQLIDYRQINNEFPNAPDPDSIPSLRGVDLPAFDGTGLRIAIVCARWNSKITSSLVAGARESLATCNVHDVVVEYVGGSYEIPAAAQILLESGRFDGVICVGCLIKAESARFEYINEAITQGIMRLNLDYKMPTIYGILAVQSEEQAMSRAGFGSGGVGHNSGKDWGFTCVESCLLKRRYKMSARL